MVRKVRHKASFNTDTNTMVYFQAKLIKFFALSLFTFSFISHANTTAPLQTLSNINDILQDKHGFIWLSGQQGLTRLDANNKITFSLNNQEWPLPFSWIHNIELVDNKLILSTEMAGLWLFDTRNGEAEKITTGISEPSHYKATLFKNNYYSYAANTNKFYRFNPSDNSTLVIDQNIGIKDIAHTQNQFYLSNNDGLYQLQGNSLVQIITGPITALTALSNAVIAITANKIYRLGDDGKQTSIKHNEKLYGLTKAYHNDSFFTVSSEGKVSKYNGAKLTVLPHNYEKSKTGRLRNMFHDASGVLWLVSSQGVEQLNENYIKNHNLTFDIPINGNEIALFDNDIIIGSYGAGLQNFLEPVFNQESNTAFTRKGLKTFDLLEVNNSLYIGCFDGLWRYDKSTNQVTKLDIVGDKLVLKLEQKNNLLYIATDGYGLYVYDLITEEMINHIDESIGLLTPEVIDVLPLDNGKIWIAHNNKVSIYQQNSHTVTTLKTPNRSKVISLVLANNKIFASTLGDGILVFNQQGDLLAHLSNNHSFTEMLLVNGEIWASGKPGLYRISPTNYQVTMIENTQQYSFVSSMLVKDDILYAIHYSGVLALDLSEQKQFNPNVIISKTTISGKAYLLNKTIEIESGNDVITLDLASLDHRPGLNKKFQYRINNSDWLLMNNNQLTLTGLASGNYHVEIMATNSLGQWSDIKAYTEINVAYPWYWTVNIRIFYAVMVTLTILLTCWLLILRTKSIRHIHNILKDDMRNYGQLMKTVQRNLQLASSSLSNNELVQGKQLIESSLLALEEKINSQEPNNLAGNTLLTAIPFLGDYLQNKYLAKLNFTLDDKIDNCNYELKADVYKVIFEALTSAIFKSNAENFTLTLQEVKHKLWLTINSDHNSFSQLTSKVDFDLASYTIRQITNKHHASLNTFTNDDGTSQLVISFPLMTLN
ncbi:putative signal transduction histidine kinase [Colwellia psychrerythraea]|uniref:Putative signal transduction histidine kinase n=2 Tax=Colwellia psychrerythraea TaxID=28229 RepID=A0A099L152_COLPS|nr:putative signal transduction histidine kinase [Colwellia psychrerythraea]